VSERDVLTLGKALSTPIRVRLLRALLAAEGQSLGALAENLSLGIGAVSHHIALLEADGVVGLEVVGRSKVASVAPGFLAALAAVFNTLDQGDEDVEEL
jgi:DNA-binding transcriptional ArsR family regulator